MAQKYYIVIVTEPDGLERVVLALLDQNIDPTVILWDERVSGGEPPAALLAKAEAEDAKRAQDVIDADAAGKTKKGDALTRLLASSNKDIRDLMELLGYA